MIRLVKDSSEVRSAIVIEAVADMADRPKGSRIVLAHRRVDVKALNERIRGQLQAQGQLTDEREYQTASGVRQFAVGDRVMFGENNRDLGVKNGMLGTVEQAGEGRLSVRPDSDSSKGGRSVDVDLSAYAVLDYGYASTVHKSQGVTVDRTFVMASKTMDRHLTYVAMTRHRESVLMVASEDEFPGIDNLKKQLSRGNAKETTLDYLTRQEHGVEVEVPVIDVEVSPNIGPSEERGQASGLPKGWDSLSVAERREVARKAERVLEKTFDECRDRLMAPVIRKQQELHNAFDKAHDAFKSHLGHEPKGLMGRFKLKAWQQEKERLTGLREKTGLAYESHDREVHSQGGIRFQIIKQARQEAEKICIESLPMIQHAKEERAKQIAQEVKQLEKNRSQSRGRGFGR